MPSACDGVLLWPIQLCRGVQSPVMIKPDLGTTGMMIDQLNYAKRIVRKGGIKQGTACLSTAACSIHEFMLRPC